MDENERIAEAIETAGESIERGLKSLAAAILEATTAYQLLSRFPKTDEVHTELEAAIGKRLRELDGD